MEAGLKNIDKVLSSDYYFQIPEYQRPYSWKDEHAETLVEDLFDFFKGLRQGKYFLGSVVLVKKPEGHNKYEILDGQQRLMTITILLSVLRYLIADTDAKQAITNPYIEDKGNVFSGATSDVRIRPKKSDASFFQQNIQVADGLKNLILNEKKPACSNDSQKLYISNALIIHDYLKSKSQEELKSLTSNLVQNTTVVVAVSGDFNTAYQVFKVLNTRGLQLNHSDIIKSEMLSTVSIVRIGEFASAWEALEDSLGRDKFSDVFSFIRMNHKKAKAKDSLLDELQSLPMIKKDDPFIFLEKTLRLYCEVYQDILDSKISDKEYQNLKWLSLVGNNDWISPLIHFYSRFGDDKIDSFIKRLDRLASFLLFTGAGENERINRYVKLIHEIDISVDAGLRNDADDLDTKDKEKFISILDGDFYNLNSRTRRLGILRLDEAMSDSGGSSFEASSNRFSIEHILPQSIPDGSAWASNFDKENHELWVHRIANLVPISVFKNSKLGNLDYADKREKLKTGKVANSPLLIRAIGNSEWSIDVLEKRQKELIGHFKTLWRL